MALGSSARLKGTCLDLSFRGRKLRFVMGSTSKTSEFRARWRRAVALAAGAAWMLAALTCPSFGQATAPDEPVAAHEHSVGTDAGHADNALCCKALGDSTTVYQALAY